jgi:hypothetical protein
MQHAYGWCEIGARLQLAPHQPPEMPSPIPSEWPDLFFWGTMRDPSLLELITPMKKIVTIESVKYLAARGSEA